MSEPSSPTVAAMAVTIGCFALIGVIVVLVILARTVPGVCT